MTVKDDIEFIKQAISQTKGHIEIDIDQGGGTIKAQVSDYLGLIMGINEIALVASKQTGESLDETFENVKILRSICNIMECESKEQLDVVREIIKRRDGK